MACPFPGVDPYLEFSGLWPDFHAKFINYWQETLADALPENYEARIGEWYNLIEVSPDPGGHRIGPDVAVTQHEPTTKTASPGGVSTLEPVTIPNVIDEQSRQTYIEVLRRPERTLVAVLELLSPSNKQGPGRSVYLDKRNRLMFQEVHLFELDLLLRGARPPLRRPLPAGDYYAFISRGDRRPDCDVYTWRMQDPLPRLPIPLKAPDPDVLLDFQPIFDITYFYSNVLLFPKMAFFRI